jgi:DNA-binding MarR family transcriptional regulator
MVRTSVNQDSGGGSGANLTRPLPAEARPNIGLVLDTLSQRIDHAIHARLDGEGFADIRPVHSAVFENVRGEGSRLTELAEQARMTKQSIQYVVDDLERLGYAERFPDPADRRAKLVRLTPRGRAAVLVAREAIADVERQWSRTLGPRGFAALRRRLEALAGT